jgi:hypothetical protein
MRRFSQARTAMDKTLDDVYWERKARFGREESERDERMLLRRRQRKQFLVKLLQGDDMFAWVVPDGCAPSDEVLSEHMAQLRNLVRYAMQFALADDLDVETNMSAATVATRMIRANAALARALKTSESKSSKTVRGSSQGSEPQA